MGDLAAGLQECELVLVPAALRVFVDDLGKNISSDRKIRIEPTRLAELHVNSIRRSYIQLINEDLYAIPVVVDRSDAAPWLVDVTTRQAALVGMSIQEFVDLILDYAQRWFTAVEQAGNEFEQNLAEKFHTAYVHISTSQVAGGVERQRSQPFDPSSFVPLPGDNDLDRWTRARERHTLKDGPFRRNLEVDFGTDRFDIVDWYVGRFRRSSDAESASHLHRAVSRLLLQEELFAGWERVPPGTRPKWENEEQYSEWFFAVQAQADESTGSSDADFIMCWLEANRLRMEHRLALLRRGDPAAKAIAFRDEHVHRASVGLRRALGFIEDVRPELHADVAPTVLEYVADLRVRTEIWLQEHRDGRVWTAMYERQQMESNAYIPPSALGRESTLWLEGRVYRYAPPDSGISGVDLGQLTERYWSEIRRLLDSERRED